MIPWKKRDWTEKIMWKSETKGVDSEEESIDERNNDKMKIKLKKKENRDVV